MVAFAVWGVPSSSLGLFAALLLRAVWVAPALYGCQPVRLPPSCPLVLFHAEGWRAASSEYPRVPFQLVSASSQILEKRAGTRVSLSGRRFDGVREPNQDRWQRLPRLSCTLPGVGGVGSARCLISGLGSAPPLGPWILAGCSCGTDSPQRPAWVASGA